MDNNLHLPICTECNGPIGNHVWLAKYRELWAKCCSEKCKQKFAEEAPVRLQDTSRGISLDKS